MFMILFIIDLIAATGLLIISLLHQLGNFLHEGLHQLFTAGLRCQMPDLLFRHLKQLLYSTDFAQGSRG